MNGSSVSSSGTVYSVNVRTGSWSIYVFEGTVEAAGKTAEILRVSKSFPQRSYFPFHDYDYRLDVSKMLALMPEVTPLDEGLKEEFEWFEENDPELNRKPYFEYIDNNLA